ncbi:DUF3783 domain-containing protein [Thermosipho atlanticus]|uniref:DUF3783 domain-containing protein n=1 Tax=Thermosipho atlanticus DSM 15807 TaxID=1123380 RepID=A0A1M5SKT6_9BACT|nr:DUF3783 domain-containing protein [Thermosipho atlanticus]SHH39095.1 protein of unknown function [Thermosipho atlanticus DSM 15807]
MKKEKSFIILHGFKDVEIKKAIKVLKENFPDKELIFATSTPTNMKWSLEVLLRELEKEYEEMKKLRKEK